MEQESESCHKTTIRGISATQGPHQGFCNDRLCRTHVCLNEGVCDCECVSVCSLLSVLQNGFVNYLFLSVNKCTAHHTFERDTVNTRNL